MYVRYTLFNILFKVNSLINIYLKLLLMVTKNVVDFKRYAFINPNILPKKGGGVCGTRMVLNFRGVWHKNDLDVKYTPL